MFFIAYVFIVNHFDSKLYRGKRRTYSYSLFLVRSYAFDFVPLILAFETTKMFFIAYVFIVNHFDSKL